ENQDGYLIDAVHHAEVDISLLARILFPKYPKEIIPHFAHLEEIFHLIVSHFISSYSLLTAIRKVWFGRGRLTCIFIGFFYPGKDFIIRFFPHRKINLMGTHGIGSMYSFQFPTWFFSFQVNAYLKPCFGSWLQNSKLLFPLQAYIGVFRSNFHIVPKSLYSGDQFFVDRKKMLLAFVLFFNKIVFTFRRTGVGLP